MWDVILAFLVTAVVTCIVGYAAAVYHNDYWKRRGVPGPKPDPVVGNMKALINPNYPDVIQLRDWTKEYGKAYGIQQGWKNILVVSDPEMIHEFMVKKFELFHGRKQPPISGNVDLEPRIHVFGARGARWKRLRTISNPVFSVNNLKKILPTVDDSCQVMMTHLDKAYEKGRSFNIHPYFHELTMDVISRISMGQQGTRQFDNDYIELVKKVFARFGNNPFITYSWMFPFFAQPMRTFAVNTSRLRGDPFRFIIDKIEAAVEQRKKLREEGKVESERSVDFIDLFLDAESDDVALESKQVYDKSDVKVSKKLTTTEIIAQCFVFLLAGFDTTANSLAITSFFLAKNPAKHRRLQEEMDEICPDGEPAYEQINKMKYADAVMKEALRLCPIAAFAASRTCSQTTTIGDITVEEGTIVQADVFSVQHDKSIWGKDADEFVPERWLSEEQRPQLAWLPFGGGPRTCIGLRLAYLEEKLALVYILRKYNIVASPETEKELKLLGLSVLNPESVTIKLEKRTDI